MDICLLLLIIILIIIVVIVVIYILHEKCMVLVCLFVYIFMYSHRLPWDWESICLSVCLSIRSYYLSFIGATGIENWQTFTSSKHQHSIRINYHEIKDIRMCCCRKLINVRVVWVTLHCLRMYNTTLLLIIFL